MKGIMFLAAALASGIAAMVMPLDGVCGAVEFPIPDAVQSWEIPEMSTNGVKAVWIEGVPWHGKETRFFAYYSLPDGASPDKKVPGIVLVHGGMGTAYHSWVKTWNARGYAAIAMDNCGGTPGEKSHLVEHPRHKWSGPNGWGRFSDANVKPDDQWVYHAVECVLRSHTFLRSLPEVDKSKIGMTGISWGGFLASIVCGVDSRLAFAAPVYGCGNLRRHSVWSSGIGERWESLWNPVQYVRNCRVPTLWCAGTNDHFFPLDSFAETALASGSPLFSIKLRMTHGHPPFGDPPEITAFADSIVKGGQKLADRKVVRREWLYTESGDPVWEKRRFNVSEEKPPGYTIRLENSVTEDGLVISSVPDFQEQQPHELTVEPGGLSPQDALLAIRAAKAKGDFAAWTVRVKPGVYTLKETLQFTPGDSGTPDAPVAWVGEGTNTVFAGGELLRDWRDEGGGVWSAPIPKSPSGESAYFEQLWVNGRRADRARFPNSSSDNPVDGCLRITAASIKAITNAEGKVTYVEHVIPSNAAALASMSADEMECAQMCVVHKWAFSRRIVKSVDPTTLLVETHSPEKWDGWKKWNPKETIVWFENVRSGFDAPGEWFYDKKAGRVMYRPLPGERIQAVQAFAPSSGLGRIVEFKGNPDKGEYVHDISFSNIEFGINGRNGPTQSYQHQAATGSDGAITAMGAHRISWDCCVFRHTGNYAMRFNDGCVSNSVTRCLMEDLGAGGVWIGSYVGHVAEGETLSRRVIKKTAPRSTAFNLIEDCVIHCGGRFNPEGTGVAFTHVSDSKVLHCDIYDFFYTGVSVGWTWGFRGSVAQRNEIAYNKIYDLGKGVMSDMGGVYTLGTSFGTRVHHNVIHDVRSYSYGGWGLYTDEGSEGLTMDHNLCWNTTDGGFHQHYGAGCLIRNNIFAFNRKLGAVRMERQVVQDVPCTLNFVNNIVVVKEGPIVGRGPRGVGGIWAGNLWYDYSGKPELDGLDWDGWKNCGKEILGMYADPQFEDADSFDFRLKPNSPAFALGFKSWNFAEAGVRMPSVGIPAQSRQGEPSGNSALRDMIAACRRIVSEDKWYGFRRTVFEFEGYNAWVAEPKCEPAAGRPWTWTMQWADAFVDRTGVLDLLAKGWRHVTIDTFSHRMDEEGLRVSRAFQKFLVDELGFAPKANLVGMSWGGFFSTRYANAFPECIAKIYLDAPLMNFDGFAKAGGTPTENAAKIGTWALSPPAGGAWSGDPRMPVNMADQLAKHGIPLLLLYGGQDQTVPPALNCEVFEKRFRQAGGEISVCRRDLFGHHPHGTDPDKTACIVDFFNEDKTDNGDK